MLYIDKNLNSIVQMGFQWTNNYTKERGKICENWFRLLGRLGVFLGIFLAVQSLDDVQAEGEVDSHHRTATAIRINSAPPQLDGVLDDEIWKSAPLHEGFHQRDPDEGKPATERTTFQIVYDDEAIYFAVMCYDSEPGKIVSRLVRRDRFC